ncbi:MAG: uracil-DNA glycosylase [Candidatus Eisenbacteria sp.]|nr:uracil-DNA glycosylase [Candidatus Eisenbacteria bacterium]
MGIEALNKEIRTCIRCRLAETRGKALCGEGNLQARLILIAQAPGENEDREGRMFIGPSGKVLDELLRRVGVDRGEVYMTNLVKCFLPRYRKPKRDEIESCSRYLDREIELIGPKALAPLGYHATRYILEKHGLPIPPKADFRSVYGKVFEGDERQILPLQHPAAALYDPSIMNVMVENYARIKVWIRQ